jgi:hypothetical protein
MSLDHLGQQVGLPVYPVDLKSLADLLLGKELPV